MQLVYVQAAKQAPALGKRHQVFKGKEKGEGPLRQTCTLLRGALVRAQYRNTATKIFPDDSFLMRFYKNVIGEEGGEMNRADMICARLFEDPSLLRNVDPKDALRKGKGEARRFD